MIIGNASLRVYVMYHCRTKRESGKVMT